MAAFQAKGKAKGKGKAAVWSSPEGGQGHLLEKSRLSAEKFTGQVVAWKGKFGWIKPAEEIEHEKASLHGGCLYVAMNDLEGVTELTPGAPAEFHIYEDSSGLGAEEVVQTGEADPDFVPKGKGKGNTTAKGGGWEASAWGGGGKADGGWGKADSGHGKNGGCGKSDGGWGAGGMKGAAKGGKQGWSLASGGAVGFTPAYSSIGKNGAAKGDKGKDKGGKGKGKQHLLPRERISAEKFSGTVAAWKGKYGWVTPAEPIEHEKAEKHKGSLFVSKDDLEGVTELVEGQVVEFHIWEDASGLGAEEVAVTA